MFNPKKTNENTASNQNGINSIVAGSFIEGTIKSSSDIRIDGHLKGDLHCQEKVVIASKALIQGNVFAKNILIQGRVEGNVKASSKVHIMTTGVVIGNLNSSKLVIEEGAVFNGASIMGGGVEMKNAKKEKHNNSASKETGISEAV